MSPAVASLIALLIAIALSLTSRINVGVAAIAFAWIVGTTIAGQKPDQVAAGFPSALFLTLAGVTFLFALAETNGTLERLANRAVGLARGNARAAAGIDLDRRHWITIGLIAVWIVGVVAFMLTVGLAAFAAAAIVVPASASDESSSIRRMAWSVIVMVCGVTVGDSQ